MAMFSEVSQEQPKRHKKPGWYRETERHLRRKKYLPVEIENLKLQLDLDRQAGPKIVAQIQPAVPQKSAVSSPTETVVISYDTKQEAIQRKEILPQILENTVKTFIREEHQVYYLRYELEWRDREVSEKLNMSRSSYFSMQRRVVLKAAQIMGVEVPEDELPEEWKGELFIIEKYLAGRGE